MTKTRRKNQPASFWRNLIAKQKSSGLSISAFCRQQRISPSNFHQWQARISSKSSNGHDGSDLVEVTCLLSDDKPEIEHHWKIELNLGNGIKLNLTQV